MGSGAKSYMRKGFLIYEEMRKFFPMYEEAISHISFCTRSLLISFFMKNILFSFLSVCFHSIKNIRNESFMSCAEGGGVGSDRVGVQAGLRGPPHQDQVHGQDQGHDCKYWTQPDCESCQLAKRLYHKGPPNYVDGLIVNAFCVRWAKKQFW